MLRIAICDDEEKDRENIWSLVHKVEEKWKTEFYVSRFSSGEALCEDLEKNKYDIILLDIIMKGISGIDTAKKIYSMDIESYIVFISSYDQRLRELFGTKTLAFLDKPVNAKQVEDVLLQVDALIKKDKENVFLFTANKVQQFVYLKDIIYFESRHQKIEIVTIDDRIIIYDTLKNIWNTLESKDEFLMPNRSYILNLRYAYMDSANSFNISKLDMKVSIGRKGKNTTTQRYLEFLRRNRL